MNMKEIDTQKGARQDMEIVSFVILHYKDRETTDACVRSILSLEEQERIRIVIVDNDVGENEEIREQLSRAYRQNPRIKVLSIYEGGGFSFANNQGYRFAKEEQKASFILVLNNDIQFIQPDFLKRLDASIKANPCHVLGPDILCQSTGEHQNPMDNRLRTEKEARFTIRMNRLALKAYPVLYPLLYWNLKREEKKRLEQRQSQETYYQTVQRDVVPFGACLIFTPEFVSKEEKAFAPETPFFYEEYLLAGRCKDKKYRIVYDPSLKALHENGKATSKTYASEKKRIRFMMERTAEAAEIYLETGIMHCE